MRRAVATRLRTVRSPARIASRILRPLISSDVVQDAMNLEIHLVEGFLHMQDMLSCHLDEAAAMSPKRSYGTYESWWSKTGTQQTDRVQILKPLAIGDVSLPARNVLHVLCVDQVDFKPASFEDLVDRNPVHAGRLHRDRVNPALLEPVSGACRSRVTVGKQRMGCASRSALTATYNSLAPTSMPAASGCRTGNASHLLLPFLAICSSDHVGRMPGARAQNKLPIEIVVGNRQTSSHVCTQPQTHASRSGFKPGTNVGAGCSCHSTGSHHHRSTRVPLHPVGPKPVARFAGLIREDFSCGGPVGMTARSPSLCISRGSLHSTWLGGHRIE
jgi:hypothetical protein